MAKHMSKIIYVKTRKEAIETKKELQRQGLDTTFRKGKRWEGYNVWGDPFCYLRPNVALKKHMLK